MIDRLSEVRAYRIVNVKDMSSALVESITGIVIHRPSALGT